MKKFLTVLLALSVVFTYSFGTVGTAFAAVQNNDGTYSYNSGDYEEYLRAQWTNVYAHKVALAEDAYDKYLGQDANKVLRTGATGTPAYAEVTASELGLTVSANYPENWTTSAVDELNKLVQEDIDKAVTAYIAKVVELTFGVENRVDSVQTAPKDATYGTTNNPIDIGDAVVYEATSTSPAITLSDIVDDTTANANGYEKAAVARIVDFAEYQEDSVYAAVTGKLSKINLDAYSAENANKIAEEKAKTSAEIAKIANRDATTSTAILAKAAAYIDEYSKLKAIIGDIKTIEDDEYADANTSASVAKAAAEWVDWGLENVYDKLKLAGNQAVNYQYNHLLNTANDKIYEKKTGNKAVLFGVEIANINKVTVAEATAVNNAMRTAIINSGDVIAAYANALEDLTDPQRVAAVRALYKNGDTTQGAATAYLSTLNKTIEAVELYAEVVEEGKVLKDTYKYGVKVYDDEKVDAAVKDAENLVYADIAADSFKTAKQYIFDAADGEANLFAANWEYDAFMKAIADAKAKFYKADGTPQVKVLYGDDKTAEADYVYLKSTYATVEADAWTAIADSAVAALTIAESYDDIDAALANAAAAMSELMKAEDEAAVVASIARHKNALDDAKAEAMKIMGTKDYSEKAFDDACTVGKELIEAADTLDEVTAAYAEAEKLLRSIPTKAELAEAEKALVAKIAALPTTSTLTVADKDAVLDALNAYLAYIAMPGAEKSKISNTYVLNADLDTVLRLVGKDIQSRVDAMAKEIAKCDNGTTDNGAAKLIELEDSIKALLEEAYDFNGTLAEVGAVKSLDVDNVAAIDNLETLEATLNAENSIWIAELHVLLAQANTAKTVAEKKAVVEAYEKLTDRQKYKMEQNLKTLIEEIKSDLVTSVEALKITAGSSAVKGAITVKWSVKGDAEAADGYQIYRSVKKNSGFGTTPIFTTTKLTYKNTKSLKKGTRYYYKVRAYAEIDGVKYYSDWSNKAYRIAK